MRKLLLMAAFGILSPLAASADQANPKPLAEVPTEETGEPAAGHRVSVTEPEYAGTDVHHSLYLPTNFGTRASYPLIVELTGNYFPPAGSTGQVEGAHLGYALTLGRDFIWVVLPYIAQDHRHNEVIWWGDEEATVAYAQRCIPRLVEKYHADSHAVILCGFSRGAIGVSYLGLHNDEIARLWAGFVTCDHFDGVREWKATAWGTPLAEYREKALARLQRVRGRPFWVSQQGSTREISDVLDQGHLLAEGNFSFHAVPMEKLFPVVPNAYFPNYHNDLWPLFDTPDSGELRRFLDQWRGAGAPAGTNPRAGILGASRTLPDR